MPLKTKLAFDRMNFKSTSIVLYKTNTSYIIFKLIRKKEISQLKPGSHHLYALSYKKQIQFIYI